MFTRICDFIFKSKEVSVNFGASFTNIFFYENWKKHCCKFFNHFYASNGTVKEVITVADITEEKEYESCWGLSINTLKKWCTFSQNSLGLIFANYDIKEHLFFLGATGNLLKQALSTVNFSYIYIYIYIYIYLYIYIYICIYIIFFFYFANSNLNEKVAHCI